MTESDMKQRLETALAALREKAPLTPQIALILGSIVSAHRYPMRKSDHALIRRAIREKHDTGEASLTDEEKQICARIAGLRWEDMWIGRPQAQTVGAQTE